MPEMTAFSFKVGRLKFHIACARYSAGGALKIAGSNWPAAFWADNPTARRTMEIANRNIWVHLFSFEPGRAATVQDSNSCIGRSGFGACVLGQAFSLPPGFCPAYRDRKSTRL